MCRMFAIIPEAGDSPDANLVRRFRTLASVGNVRAGSRAGHKDGWGIVIWEDGHPMYLGREPVDASTDNRFDEASKLLDDTKPSSLLIAHLRKASRVPRIRANTHPFTQDRWAFAHNGTVHREKPKRTTDSEWFFRSLMQRRGAGSDDDMADDIARQVGYVKNLYSYSSLTFLLSDGHTLYAYRDCTGDEQYYTMHYAMVGRTLVVSQERFFDANWMELGNGHLLTADRTLKFKTEDMSNRVMGLPIDA